MMMVMTTKKTFKATYAPAATAAIALVVNFTVKKGIDSCIVFKLKL